MKVLVTGKGSAGSWIVRGEQLGAAMGATVKSMATIQDMRAHDVVLVVKKLPDELLLNLWRSGVRWVYDIVDAYPQPACSSWNEAHSKQWLREHIKKANPNAVVFPNKRMREDWGLNGGHVVYHHHRPGIEQHVPNERIARIGYEGSAKYIDAWLTPVLRLCQDRNISFHVNPRSIANLDVVIAMRGGVWDGYPQRSWKSNVKLANAHGAGVPFIGSREEGYKETASGAEYWVDDVRELERALDWLDGIDVRNEVSRRFKESAYTVEQAAADMLAVLREV